MSSTPLEGRFSSTSDRDNSELRGKLWADATRTTNKSDFLLQLRELYTLGVTVPQLIGLAGDYNLTRAIPNYQVDRFIIQNPDGSFSEVDVRTGEVKPKKPYPILPKI